MPLSLRRSSLSDRGNGRRRGPSAKRATQTIPLVFVSSADPEQLGLVASLRRPGGNATGITLLQDALASKRLEPLKEVAPRISKVAFVTNPDHPDNEAREARRAALALGVDLLSFEVRNTGDFERAFRAIIEVRADSLYVVSSRHTVLNMPAIVGFATSNRLPLAGGWGDWAKAGGLLAYGPNVGDMAQGPPATSTGFSKGPNRQSYLSNSRPNSS